MESITIDPFDKKSVNQGFARLLQVYGRNKELACAALYGVCKECAVGKLLRANMLFPETGLMLVSTGKETLSCSDP